MRFVQVGQCQGVSISSVSHSMNVGGKHAVCHDIPHLPSHSTRSCYESVPWHISQCTSFVLGGSVPLNPKSRFRLVWRSVSLSVSLRCFCV